MRPSLGRQPKTSFGIADAQSVKNTETAEKKGYDAGKKVSGIKRHLIVDTNGLPHAIEVTTADVTDRAGALLALTRHKDNLSDVGGLYGRTFCCRCEENHRRGGGSRQAQ